MADILQMKFAFFLYQSRGILISIPQKVVPKGLVKKKAVLV